MPLKIDMYIFILPMYLKVSWSTKDSFLAKYLLIKQKRSI